MTNEAIVPRVALSRWADKADLFLLVPEIGAERLRWFRRVAAKQLAVAAIISIGVAPVRRLLCLARLDTRRMP